MNSELLKILCCPETHQELRLADSALVEKLNQQIASGSLKNRTNQPVREKLDGALVRADKKFLYPIRQNIPVMLVDEAIAFNECSNEAPAQSPTIVVEIILLSEAEGGRKQPLTLSPPEAYRPHLVVGSLESQRPSSSNNENYLGVIFISGPAIVRPGDSFRATVALLYFPRVDYSALVTNAHFTLCEGPRIVGYGKVLKRN